MTTLDYLQPLGQLTTKEVEEIESQLGVHLPEDYRTFLSETNGGYPKESYMVVRDSTLTDELLINCFLGKSIDENFDIIGWNKLFDNELPSSTVIFGVEYGGGMFIQILEGADKGVYFWDSNFGLPGTTEESNAFFLANTFSEFFAMIIVEES